MDAAIAQLVDISGSDAAMQAKADMMLERACWASQVFQRYDRERTYAIAEATARAAFDKAGEYGEWAVRETGFGVAKHKKLKNELSSVPFVEFYKDWDFVNPRMDDTSGLVKIPRPAGVVFALVPSTNPIATVYFKILCALMTRNAVVLCPHPAARECCIDAVATLSQAAEAAGAPEAVIQVVAEPNIPLINEFMRSEKTDVILATGGTAMVRAAYSSSNPAIGVGPGNAPVFVDDTANIDAAAGHIADSKAFDNSVLCTNESVLITLDSVAGKLKKALSKAGAHICSEDEVTALRRYLFHERGFNVEAVGRDASWIAEQAGIKVSKMTKVLVTPIDMIGFGEDLSREKLCPVLGFYVATSVQQATMQARALLRFAGAGHSAAIHSENVQTILDYSAAVESYRVVVNAPCSQGAAGFDTNLAPTFTIGTGFFGRSSIGENIGPQHLVNWTRIAWHKDAVHPSEIGVLSHPGPLQKSPSDGVPGETRPKRNMATDGVADKDDLRERIRLIIAEELRAVLKD